MGKFNIGDRVICLVDSPADNSSIHEGDTGTVCNIEDWDDDWVGVCWDKPVDGGHDCRGDCEYGYGWGVPPATLDFEPEDDKPPFQFDEDEFNNLFS